MRAVRTALCCAVLLASGAVAKADGWSLANLNPFANNAPAKPAPKNGIAGQAAPQLRKPTAPAKPPPQPNVFQNIGNGASNMMNKTKQLFTPKPAASGSSAASKSTASSWNPFAQKKPDPQPPQTVSEFIGQPRQRL